MICARLAVPAWLSSHSLFMFTTALATHCTYAGSTNQPKKGEIAEKKGKDVPYYLEYGSGGGGDYFQVGKRGRSTPARMLSS